MTTCTAPSPGFETPPTFETLREGDFHARLAQCNGLAVVLFSNAGCGTCKRWRQVLPEALDGLTHALFEVDVAEATGLARYFDIFHLPTIYLYRDGHFHAELQVEARAPAIRAALKTLLAAPAQDEP
jgi:thioredoxin-like negative regulator of GroEL